MLYLKISHKVHTVHRNGEEVFAFRVYEETASSGVADQQMGKKNGVKQVNTNVTENSMERPQK